MNPVCENVETSEGVPLTVTGEGFGHAITGLFTGRVFIEIQLHSTLSTMEPQLTTYTELLRSLYMYIKMGNSLSFTILRKRCLVRSLLSKA